MDFTDYQKAAMRTAGKTERPLDALACAGLGVAGEAGEVADLIKKVLFHAHPLDPATLEKLLKEAGDVLWYVALLAETLGVSMDRIAELNIEKLHHRHPLVRAARAALRARAHRDPRPHRQPPRRAEGGGEGAQG
jgi:NTP pyrophosphatase (non-canonical NTP hydrolase)